MMTRRYVSLVDHLWYVDVGIDGEHNPINISHLWTFVQPNIFCGTQVCCSVEVTGQPIVICEIPEAVWYGRKDFG